MLKRRELGERMFEPAQVETALGLLAGEQPATTREFLRRMLADGATSLDQRLKASGPLEPQRFSLPRDRGRHSH
jgi:hypothetical protein